MYFVTLQTWNKYSLGNLCYSHQKKITKREKKKKAVDHVSSGGVGEFKYGYLKHKQKQHKATEGFAQF